MRLASLTLEHYGPFERLELPLDPTPGRINLVVAPNGYGKSVVRQAIGDLLFGIPERTPMDFRFGTERMRVSAKLVGPDGARLLVRRKGRGVTLTVDGSAAAPDFARELVGTANRKVFEELFGLDTALLRSGGQQLIQSQGRLGQVLYAAGGGMGRVRELLASLEKQRDELGRTTRHRSRPVWSALSSWEEAKDELRKAAMKPDDWGKLERDAAEAAARLAALRARHGDGEAARARLRTMAAVRPWLARLAEARFVLEEAAGAPELDAGFEPRWREALAEGARAASTKVAAEAALVAATEARAALSFDAAWLEVEAEVDALAKARGRALGAEDDLPGVRAALADGLARGAELRRELGWGAAVALPPASVVRAAQARLRDHPKLAADLTAAEAARATAADRLSATRAELADLADPADTDGLGDHAKLLRAKGDPAGRLEEGRGKLRAAEAALADAVAAIPDRPLRAAGLGDTVAPSDAGLDAAEKALSQAEAAQAQAARELAARLGDVSAVTHDLAALERTALLPAPDALAAARARRDALWADMCSSPPGASGAVAFDRALREADGVADALIAHGREVGEAVALRERLAALEVTLPTLRDAVVRADARLAGARAELAAMARAAGGDGERFWALRPFLKARADAVRRLGERDAAAAELAATEAGLATLGARLAAMLGVATTPVEALGALLAEVDRQVEAARNLAVRRAALVRQDAELAKTRATADAAARKAVEAMAAWQADWGALVGGLDRPGGEAPAATGEALARMDELRAIEKSCAEAQVRVADMLAAGSRLLEQVARLARLTPEYAHLPPAEAADAFARRFQREKSDAARCRDADARVTDATAKLEASRQRAAAAGLALRGLRAALAADTDDAAERQIGRAREVAAARKQSADARLQLSTLGGGLSADVLFERAAETTAEADAAASRDLDASQAELANDAEAARDARQLADTAMERAGSGTDAAEAAQRREAAQAALARHAEDALVLHAAHSLLQAALDRQAAAADQPLLNRISAVFRDITGGAQRGVVVEETGSGQTMLAHEADGVTRKPLDQLSEGTSDQLYLALRIAALEDYAAAAPPLPFVADDVLQTFDDPRTTATLRALLGLSAHVQVIALTHHRHVGELAASLPNGAAHVVRLES